jgi:uncharacterized protein
MEVQSDRIAATLPGPAWLLPRTFLGRQARTRDRLLGSTDDVVRQGRAEHPARWFREYMAYDPARDLPSIRCPVLAITGASDLQVEPDDVARIGELVGGPFEGDTPEALTHLLRKHPGRPSIPSYRAQMKHPVDAELLARIATWVAGRA